ncbi:E3 ubiquitin-protein ligase RNF170-like isoform X2 [Dermacentor albipictus]|uniref:E3 ubiquitin-protein ligase RNF170-like isoform X2 n=1 Tax=Dermacentor albipictus TaxID=60249 RepID=UPI0031FBC596
MCTDDAGGLIEGVGNEVLFTVPVVAAVVVGLLGFAGWQQLRQLPSSSPAEQPPRRELTSARLNNGATAVSPVAEHSSSMETAPHYGSDAQCPICLAEPRHPVETNCGHLFCASCLVSYWHHGNWRGAVRCPVCRQQVSVMLRCFQDQHLANETDAQREERARLLRDINDYNRRYSGEPRPCKARLLPGVPESDDAGSLVRSLRHLSVCPMYCFQQDRGMVYATPLTQLQCLLWCIIWHCGSFFSWFTRAHIPLLSCAAPHTVLMN